jgi:hypothetical protein
MSSLGGVYSSLQKIPQDQVFDINPKVKSKSILGYTAVGEALQVGTYSVPLYRKFPGVERSSGKLLGISLLKERLKFIDRASARVGRVLKVFLRNSRP